MSDQAAVRMEAGVTDAVTDETAAVGATGRALTDMQERTAGRELPASSQDRELTELRRRQIVEGASTVLFEKGFHGCSIRDIARACGMSMGQLYHYIGSKDDILFLMHVYSQEMWHQHLAEAGFDAIADPVEKLEHGLRITIKFLSQNRDLYQFLYTESKYLDGEHLAQVLELDDQNVVGFYRHLLSQIPGYADREHADLGANLVAFDCVFLALRGWNLHLHGETDVDAAVDYLVDFLFRGLGIERTASRADATQTTQISEESA